MYKYAVNENMPRAVHEVNVMVCSHVVNENILFHMQNPSACDAKQCKQNRKHQSSQKKIKKMEMLDDPFTTGSPASIYRFIVPQIFYTVPNAFNAIPVP